MPKLPVISGKDCIKVLAKAGFRIESTKGSHVVLVSKTGKKVTVPLHSTLDRGTLRSGIIKRIGMTVQEFIDLLNK